jgi:PhoH-like ATPase
VDKIYNGFRELEIGKDMIHAIEKGEEVAVDAKMVANEFAILKNPKEKGFRLGRYSLTAEKLQPVQPLHNPVSGIRPLNVRQQLAFDLLLDPKIQLVTMTGKAGTGKPFWPSPRGSIRLWNKKPTRGSWFPGQ